MGVPVRRVFFCGLVQGVLTNHSLCSGKIEDACKFCNVSVGGEVLACQCAVEYVGFLDLGKSFYSLPLFYLVCMDKY